MNIRTVLIAIVIVLIFVVVPDFVFADVDPTFAAVPSRPAVPNRAVQADGKIVLWGDSVTVRGVAKGRIARLNVDSTLDPEFVFCECGLDVIANVAPLPDGKILVSGSTGGLANIIRLNDDGTRDLNFNFLMPVSPNSLATVVEVLSDGRFFATRQFSQMGFSGVDLYRFHANGTLDESFSGVSIGFGTPNQSSLGAVAILPDGRIYVAVNTAQFGNISTRLLRYNADASSDTSWTPPNIIGSNWTTIRSLAIEADGDLLVSGNFSVVNGLGKAGLVRLKAAGNVDLEFTGPWRFSGEQVKVLNSGKILYSAIPANGDGGVHIDRLETDGNIDKTYEMESSLEVVEANWVIDHLNRVITGFDGRLGRLLADGSIDPSFNPVTGSYGRIHAMARQSDGKFLIAGEFARFNGVSAASFVRTHPDGTIDATFDVGIGFNSLPAKIVVQSDGKLIVIGDFTAYNGVPKRGIVRLLPDGGIDPTFELVPGPQGIVRSVDVLPDGKIYIGGTFSEINGTPRSGVARLNADGTLDSGFTVLIGGSPNILSVVAQPDGKVLIGGSFTGIGGFNRSNLARVDAAGNVDASFDPTSSPVGQIYLQDDRKILTAPAFSSSTVTLTRRFPDGSIDPGFTFTEFTGDSFENITIDSVLIRQDGALIVVGSFRKVNSSTRIGITRLRPNGDLDPLFLSSAANARVRAVIAAGSDKILVGGDFTRIQNTSKAGVARIAVAPLRNTTPYDFDGDGRSDLAVFRPSTNDWYILRSSDWTMFHSAFGADGDVPVPADFDADGRTDLAIFRPTTGVWWYAASASSGTHRGIPFGVAGDIPIPSDFDGDGRTDVVIYRPSNNNWYRLNAAGNVTTFNFGLPGDIPLIGDFDHDGKTDPAIFRPSTGDWWYAASSAGNAFRAVHWGMEGDIPVPADFDGDGKIDHAVFRPSDGGWYIFNSATQSATTLAFGLNSDVPVVADYDGDGSADIAVFRPQTGVWYLWQSTSGFMALNWGTEHDIPAQSAYLP